MVPIRREIRLINTLKSDVSWQISPGSGFGGGSLGLLLGVCTLQILMKPAMSMMRAMPISSTAHQCAWRGEKRENVS